ncbi:MAG: carbohydrate ABC transporter substrate-binding protein, partial [Microbacterium sp.]
MTRVAAVSVAAILPLSFALTSCSGGSGGGDDDNTLTVWAWDPTFNIYAMQEAEKIYQVDHPDFKLDIVETPWDDLQTKLTTIGQAGTYDELP